MSYPACLVCGNDVHTIHHPETHMLAAPPFECRCCGTMLVAPHWSAADCPGFGHEPPVIVEIADGESTTTFRWAARDGWTDDGINGPGHYPPERTRDPITHAYGDQCHAGPT